MSWDPFEQPIDFVLVAGKRTPGLADVVGADDDRKIRVANPYGLTGARYRFLAVELTKFKIILRLYSSEDWADWEAFRPILAAPSRRKVIRRKDQALDVVHPHLAAAGVKAALVTKVGQPAQDSTGVWTITLEFIEWRPPRPSMARIDGAKATEKQPDDPYDRIIKDLSAQLQETAAS